MRKYNFKLEPILSIRESIEKEWEAKLGSANGECQKIMTRINHYREQITISKNNAVEITQYQIRCIYEARLEQQILKAQSELKEKEQIRDQVKEVYLEKSRDRKVIDKIKDKSIAKHKKYVIKEETQFVDEINNASKIRETMLGGAS